jgi:prepilin-type N-terminal cleavage/methylation domain-containing protein
MIFRTGNHKTGFSLVELMVVVGIILVFLSIIMASIIQARENTREKKRISDLANIEFAMTLYNEKNRSYPAYPSGIVIGTGGALDAVIQQYNGNVYSDPLNGTSGYEYYYDSSFTCYQANQKVLFVRTMEQSKNGNFSSVCTDSAADTSVANANSYIRVLKQ